MHIHIWLFTTIPKAKEISPIQVPGLQLASHQNMEAKYDVTITLYIKHSFPQCLKTILNHRYKY